METHMLSVTQSAVQQLAEMLEEAESDEDEGLRLMDQGEGRLTLAVDETHEGDQVVGNGTRAVLFIDPELSDALDGTTLDTVDGPDGTQLTLIRPGAAHAH
jgi:Fe-S cluster assembly iron-binding protein IscA